MPSQKCRRCIEYYQSNNKEAYMKINKEELERLAALPDEELWGFIVSLGRSHGFELPEGVPPHAELERLRGAVRGDRINYRDALKVLNGYRKGEKR